MAKKQFNTVPEGAAGASAAAAKQTTKPSASAPVKSNKSNSTIREPRVSTAKHSRGKSTKDVVESKDAVESQASEALAMEALALDAVSSPVPFVDLEIPVAPMAAPAIADARQAIEKLAYSYFESRGYRYGNPLEDWVRAEREYYGR